MNSHSRLDTCLSQDHIDALLLRLPENVVYLSGMLPVHGVTAVFYLPGAGVHLLQPVCELQWVPADVTQVSSFEWGHLNDVSLTDSYRGWCKHLAETYGNQIHTLGTEQDFGTVAPAFSSAEGLLPDQSWSTLLQESFARCELRNAIPTLNQARALKSDLELDLLRRCNRIAGLGLDALAEAIRPGMREVEAAGLVENTIRTEGTGFQSARLVRAFAHVSSGPQGSYLQSMLTPSGNRKMERGDLVMIEMAVCADGYWCDLTRTYAVGQPQEEQIRCYNAVLSAQQAAASRLIPGQAWGEADRAARQVLATAGLGQYFTHGTGHGVGYRYHETIPQLNPGETHLFEPGMVTSVEPGIYIPHFGGIRIEDNLAVGEDGPIWLSSPAAPWR